MFRRMPTEMLPVSNAYLVACVAVTLLCYFGYFNKYDLFFDKYLIFVQGQVYPLKPLVLEVIQLVLLSWRFQADKCLLYFTAARVLHRNGGRCLQIQGCIMHLLHDYLELYPACTLREKVGTVDV